LEEQRIALRKLSTWPIKNVIYRKQITDKRNLFNNIVARAHSLLELQEHIEKTTFRQEEPSNYRYVETTYLYNYYMLILY
jgi:hypothetical protein